jgi:phage FluMu gp28-like protein
MNLGQFKIKFAEGLFSFENKPLKLYDYQKKLILDENRYRIVNKARQLGLSLCLAIEALIECLINPNYTVLFVSTGEEAAKRILDYVYDLINSMPDHLRPRLSVQTKTEIRFVNKSKLVSLPSNPSTIRGYRAHRVYIDEAAHFLNDKEIFSAIQPSISRGGKMTVVSTPFGRANTYYEIWDTHPLYTKHKIPWFECPDPKYVEGVKQDKKDMDEIEFSQEYECNFCSDEMAYFPFSLLRPCIDDSLFNLTELRNRNICRL